MYKSVVAKNSKLPQEAQVLEDEIAGLIEKPWRFKDYRSVIVEPKTIIRIMKGRRRKMLVRNHLLCPYADCVATDRSRELRIQVLVNQVNDTREVSLKEIVKGEKGRTSLPYKHTKEEYRQKCPYCQRPITVVIDETHNGRNIYLRLPQ